MALLKPAPPAASVASFTAGLPTYLSGPKGPIHSAFVGKLPAIPTLDSVGTGIVEAQRVFTLNVHSAARATGSISPTPGGWRFFAGSSSWALGRMVQRPPSMDWNLIAVHYGDVVLGDLEQSRALAGLPVVQAADYELRFLEIPGINVKAFWLAAQKPPFTDYFVPLTAVLKARGPYTLPAFLAAIRPLAAVNLTLPAGHGA